MTTEDDITWSKADIIPPKCNILSIKCKGQCSSKPFQASYEKKRNERPSIKALLSWEYARIWHEEHDKYLEQKRNLEAKAKLKFKNDKLKEVGNWKLQIKKESTSKNIKEKKHIPLTCNKSKNQKPKVENSKKQNNEKTVKEKTIQKEKSVKIIEPKIEKTCDHHHSKEDELNSQNEPCSKVN